MGSDRMTGTDLLRHGPRQALARFAALVLLGAVAALGQAPVGLWPLTILAVAVALLWLAHAVSSGKARAFVAGWAFGLGYFAASLHWIVEPFFVDAPRDGWMAPFALVFMAGGMALFWGAAVLAARAVAPRIEPVARAVAPRNDPVARAVAPRNDPVARAVAPRSEPVARAVSPRRLVALVAAFSAAEITRSLILTGFPWALLGHIWIDTRVAALAALVGPHGLTLLTLGLSAAVAALVAWGRGGALVGAAALLGAGYLALVPGPPQVPDPDADDAPIVRLVQPNAEQNLKWEPGMAEEFFGRLLRLTAQGDVPDLVVWPETAIQYLLETSQAQVEAASEAARGAPLVTGVVRQGDAGYYNSLVVIERGARITGIYDKWHLVPFGEYFPFADTLNALGLGALTGLVGGGYAVGPGPEAVSLPGIGRALALICYEGIFAEEVNALAERPRLILLITNDAWFGDWAGPAQHFAQARLRAIEQGLPVVRVANTGISGMIDARGQVTASLPLGALDAIDAVLPAALAPPPYTRYGDWPAMFLTLLLAIASAVANRRPARAIG